MTFLEFKRYNMTSKRPSSMTSEELGKLRFINRNKLNPFALGASQVEKPLTLRQFFTDNFRRYARQVRHEKKS